ncbi:hypothetical protein [Parvularcula lutaonensis]|uniref:Uncharacterized protein n=1 Tax=Parvularcula lutaonensis TaxID=491923 RepID=A0ABV7MEN0_9PROT|nr:hypothetical protein [Parvularcula lutaonensis]GGY57203.1 hypothetical protein GCM10007148_28340 [Parvularcula lutaonensis]
MAGTLTKIGLIALVAASIAGCRVQTEVCYNRRCSTYDSDNPQIRRQGEPFEAGFLQSMDFPTGTTYRTSSVEAQVNNADFSFVSFDLSNSTFDIGSNSTVTITAWQKSLKHSEQTFDLNEVNDILTIANPAAVDAFVDALPGSITNIVVSGAVDIPNPQAGWQILDVETVYQGQVLERGATSIYVENQFPVGSPCFDEFGNINICP